ncbi:MAG TPA: endolytic transglycosylase MltG [Chitinophagaceae bacterium]|nr:endolytic transglycosylase MltG [Chitinophagaceae bacterium]
MRRIAIVVLLLILIVGAYFAWIFLGPATGFKQDVKYLYIPTGTTSQEAVMQLLEKDSIVKHPGTFNWLASRMDYWKRIRPGKYKIGHGEGLISIVKKLRNGQQEPVNIVILKFRTREALAGAIGKKLECDSLDLIQFMNNPDSLKTYGLDTNTVMSAIFPDTYTHFWNTTPRKVFNKFYEAYKDVWTAERKQKAAAQGLTPTTAYILASIIEEETNDKSDKPLMASVYLNRMRKGIRLGADPTVKFALRDFALKRIYTKHTAVESPYNTYRNPGLPPGPICTPGLETLDAVLNAPVTDYLFFVAKSDFSGKHVFTSTHEEHLKYAREFHRAQDERGIR